MNAEIFTLGDRLQVAFQRTGDRYSHVIALRRSGETATLLSSCEGTPDQWWPASPPLQQLHFTDLENGSRAALLVGLAGRSHWSLSVVADGQRDELLFDVACRANLQPERLGSQYCPAIGVDLRQETDVIIQLGAETCSLAIDSIEGEASARLLFAEPNLLIDLPPVQRRLPATFRWKYRLALQP